MPGLLRVWRAFPSARPGRRRRRRRKAACPDRALKTYRKFSPPNSAVLSGLMTWATDSAKFGCSKFLYGFKAARNGPLTSPPGRVPVPPLSLGPGAQAARRLACRAGSGRSDDRGRRGVRVRTGLAGSRPVRPVRRGPVARARPPGRVTAVGARGGGASVTGPAPPTSRALRVASDGPNTGGRPGRWSLRVPGGQGSRGRPLACPHDVRTAAPAPDSRL